MMIKKIHFIEHVETGLEATVQFETKNIAIFTGRSHIEILLKIATFLERKLNEKTNNNKADISF